MEAVIQTIVGTNNVASATLNELNAQLDCIKSKKTEARKQQLRNENANLRKQIESAKIQLIELETKNGKRQIPVPGAMAQNTISASTRSKPNDIAATVNATLNSSDVCAKAPKEKKPKKEKPAAGAMSSSTANTNNEEAAIDIGRIDLRVGKIIEIEKHPDADSLYVEKIDLAEATTRTIVSGLVKHVPIDEMLNRLVVVMCNLKPAKMRGVTSDGMVMCASTPEKVEVLQPPTSCVPGDLVHCEGYERNPDAQLNPKKKIFETVAPDLRTNDALVACYKNAPLYVPEKGPIKAATLKNVNVR